MNGIERIVSRIGADAEAEAAALDAQARAEAQRIAAEYDAQARDEAEKLLAQSREAAQARLERLESMAALEARKQLLAVKQELVSAAFDRALEQLTGLAEGEYIELLARLAAGGARTGREELIFSPADRERVGRQVADRANAMLAEAAKNDPAPHRAAAGLHVAEESRDMAGGVILRDDEVETSCAFETLLRLRREELAHRVAGILFA